MNPARAFGPQLVANHWTDWWVWYVGPLAGAILAAVLYEVLYLRPTRAGAGRAARERRRRAGSRHLAAFGEDPIVIVEEPPPGTAAAD